MTLLTYFSINLLYNNSLLLNINVQMFFQFGEPTHCYVCDVLLEMQLASNAEMEKEIN